MRFLGCPCLKWYPLWSSNWRIDEGGGWCELLLLLAGWRGPKVGSSGWAVWRGVPEEAMLKVSFGGLLDSGFIREKKRQEWRCAGLASLA